MGLWDSFKSVLPGGDNNPLGYGFSEEGKSMIPGIGDAMAAKEQNKANIAAADKAMEFSERMSSTAYQRAMDDMKKAGLNPMLAFSQGGASTPSGVTPTINSTTKTAAGSAAISALTGVGSYSTAKQQADTQQATAESSINLNKASAAKTVADTEKTRVETIKARKDIPRAELEEKLSRKATDTVESLLKGINTTGKNQSRFGEVMGTMKNGLKYFFGNKNDSKPQPVKARKTGTW